MRSRWFHVPTLHTADSGEKKPGWLELFYDLVFVAAFIQLGNGLAQTPDIETFMAFCGLFVPLWLSWTGFTYYANRFTVDDFSHRMLVFGQMFAVGGMAIFAPEVIRGNLTGFVLAYALSQALVGVLYYRTWKQLKEGRDYSAYWGGVFGVGAVAWLVSLAVPQPFNYLLWAVGIGAVFSSPFGRRSRALLERYPIDFEHLSERYGLLTLIVLGESFVKVLSAVADIGHTEATQHLDKTGYLGIAALTLLITCSLWWIYFDDVAGSHLKKGRLLAPIWLFAHIPVQLGLTATGVALKKVVLHEPLSDPFKYPWLLCGSLAIAMTGVALLDSVTARKQSEMSDRARINVRVVSALVILLTAQIAGGMPAWLFLTIISAMCFAQVFFDLMMAPLAAEAHGHHHKTVAEETKHALAEGREAPRPDVSRIGQVVRKGTPNDLKRDLYFYLMEGSWWRVLTTIAFLFLLLNMVFAGLYMLEDGSIATARPGNFADHFFFSVQTMSTVGYGVLNPASAYGNLLMTFQVGLSLIMVAMATGLMFARASRAKASVLFSDVLIVTKRYGRPALMLRVGNARGNEIVDANLSLSVLRDEITPEGDHMRRLYDLKLERSRQPFFQMTWSVIHTIDDESPLKDVDWSQPTRGIIMIAAILSGHDGTYGQTIYARHNYTGHQIRANHRFVDVISQLPDGRMLIDYERFHDTVPADAPTAPH